MFKIENKTIHITRGDIACIEVKALNEDGTNYAFQVGDILRFKVFQKKDCGCVELQKDVEITETTTAAEIHLTSENTKIGGIISKPVVYWFEVELNPDTNPQTIIGYDEDGAKEFWLFPEGSDE
jgi:hypothetical protein